MRAVLVRVAGLGDGARLGEVAPRVVEQPAAAAQVGRVAVEDELRRERDVGVRRDGRGSSGARLDLPVRVRVRLLPLLRLLDRRDAEAVRERLGRRECPAAAAVALVAHRAHRRALRAPLLARVEGHRQRDGGERRAVRLRRRRQVEGRRREPEALRRVALGVAVEDGRRRRYPRAARLGVDARDALGVVDGRVVAAARRLVGLGRRSTHDFSSATAKADAGTVAL